MDIQPARWQRNGDPVEILANGQVLEDGDLVFVVDTVGRAVDADYEPVALLFPDGRLVGTNSQDLGHVGINNASPPGSATAWLSVRPNGDVVVFDYDGERQDGGRWSRCDGAAHRVCTYVTHLFALRESHRAEQSGGGVSVGVGMGFYH